MSAIRTRDIRHGFWLNGDLCALSRDARLLFIGLWCLADREGRLDGRPMQIRRHIFPFDADMTAESIEEILADLERAGFVLRYEVGGEAFILVCNFKKHQSPHPAEARSRIPPHPSETQVKPKVNPSEITPGAKANYSSEPFCPTEPYPSETQVKPKVNPSEITPGAKANYSSEPFCPTEPFEIKKEPPAASRLSPTEKPTKPKRVSKRPETDIPPDWMPDASNSTTAAELRLDISAEAGHFIEHHASKGSRFVDWHRAFGTWLRNSAKFARGRTSGKGTGWEDRTMYAYRERKKMIEQMIADEQEASQ